MKLRKTYKKIVKRLENRLGDSFLCSRNNLSYKVLNYLCKSSSSLKPGKLVAINGFFYSGSSAVVGFFNEFDNISVWGYSDSNFSKNSKDSSEITFFSHSALFKIVSAFKNGSQTEKDYAIKKFINDIYTCYDYKKCTPYEYNPQLYSCDFLIDSLEFIKKVVDIDCSAPSLTNKRLPWHIKHNDTSYDDCNFVIKNNSQRYLWYEFKELSDDDFNNHVSLYINKIISRFMTNKFVVCDQIFSGDEALLTNFNNFSKEKALQICIYRDPRDQFFSAYKHQLMDTCIGVDEFVNFYKYKLGLHQMLNTPNKNRVMIRFEDLVLKYDETTQKIMEFCGINPADHITPKSVFDPAISAVNIGAWRNFIDQDVMQQIEEKLGEYCYYPEQEHLSEEAWALLKATR